MALQQSVAVRNARLDQVEATIGASAVLKIFSGAQPANCAAADPAGLLVTINLPADWMANAAAGTKAKLGAWTGNATGAGVAASWRIYDNGLAACHLQGNCGLGSGDMSLDNTNIAVGQAVTVNTFTLTAGNS